MGPLKTLRSDGEAWAEALASTSWQVEILKQDGDVTVSRARLLGRDVVVKCWRHRRLKRRLQAIVNATPGCRHWSSAQRLSAAGIRTAATHALVRGRDASGPFEVLVMERLEGRTLLEHVARSELTVREMHALARQVGEHVAASILNNVVCVDGKASNIIVLDGALGVIDCADVRGVSDDDPGDALFVLIIEMIGVGCPPRRTLAMRTLLSVIDAWGELSVSRRAFRNEVWRSVEQWVREHGDATPKVDPLAPNERRT
ncbi:MAG: hypothetical protein ACF8LL_12685 [Phycisphaerales bacterium]